MALCSCGGASDFYPRSPCGERPRNGLAMRWNTCISIHALLAESDDKNECTSLAPKPFLSTLSLRRATGRRRSGLFEHRDFYPRSPCGERRGAVYLRAGREISIHALLAESDYYPKTTVLPFMISIHALLAESDRCRMACGSIPANFYPRSPCGERQEDMIFEEQMEISIHALLAESDTPKTLRHCTTYLFLSTLSLRRATYTDLNSAYGALISIHALLAESDLHFFQLGV